MVAPAPHLNGHYTIFGEAVDGFEVSGGPTDHARVGRSGRCTARMIHVLPVHMPQPVRAPIPLPSDVPASHGFDVTCLCQTGTNSTQQQYLPT
jgi:cyclophilin family peptidyl-prolyl cis-trans isomerase